MVCFPSDETRAPSTFWIHGAKIQHFSRSTKYFLNLFLRIFLTSSRLAPSVRTSIPFST